MFSGRCSCHTTPPAHSTAKLLGTVISEFENSNYFNQRKF